MTSTPAPTACGRCHVVKDVLYLRVDIYLCGTCDLARKRRVYEDDPVGSKARNPPRGGGSLDGDFAPPRREDA